MKFKLYELPMPRVFNDATAFVIGKRGEKNLRKVTRCKLTPRSGAGNLKGDGVHDSKRMMEKKATLGKSIIVRRDDIEKLSKQAFDANCEPVFVFEFEAMKFGAQQWGVVPLERLMELFEAEEKLKQDT